ncbi:MAG: hypothetical protein J6A16_07350 [Oscillospiraceae bacterium]|nr:hypothetical protein [Oscillospiraceae bacterium]
MVWNGGSSALYKAVERHNGAAEKAACESVKKNDAPKNTQPLKKHGGPAPAPAAFMDKDTLLIAALILILINEKADRTLIFALVFVLLS